MKKLGLILFLAVLLFLTSCISYKRLYREAETHLDKKMISYLIYWEKPDKIREITILPRDRRTVAYKKAIERVASQLGLKVDQFKSRQEQRIREANLKFGSIQRGMFTDKGKIWIKYGEPERMEENVSSNFGTADVWTYVNPPRTFYFVERGSGFFLANPGEDNL